MKINLRHLFLLVLSIPTISWGQLPPTMGEKNQDTDITPATCKVDPWACGESPELYKNHQNPKILEPSPLCVIDPCACYGCETEDVKEKSVRKKFLFESSAPSNTKSAQSLLAIKKNRTMPTYVKPPSLQYASPLLKLETTGKHDKTDFSLSKEQAKKVMKRLQTKNLQCGDPTIRPEEVWREYLVTHKNTKICSKFAATILNLRDQVSEKYFSILNASKDFDSEADITIRPFQDYASFCLSRLSDTVQSPIEFSLGKNFSDKARRNTGRLTRPGEPVYCNATLIKQEGEAVNGQLGLVTAAHCLGNLAPLGDQVQFIDAHRELTLTLLNGETYGVQVDKSLRGFAFDPAHDLMILPLNKNRKQLVGRGFEIGSTPAVWDPLYIVGFNPFIFALDRRAGSNKTLGDAATISLQPSCRVSGINGSELRHNCQTERGMSGSPIFTSENGIAKLVGIHTGAIDPDVDLQLEACGAKSAAALNRGVLVGGSNALTATTHH